MKKLNKKVFFATFVFIILAVVVFVFGSSTKKVFATVPTVSLSGPTIANVGDTVTFVPGVDGYASYDNNFDVDPFYLRSTGKFGEYKIMNPGTTVVSFRVGLVGQFSASKTLTITGVGQASSKGIKISLSKDLTGIMFAQFNGDCRPDGNNCVYPWVGLNGLGVVDNDSSPAVWTGIYNLGSGGGYSSGVSWQGGPVYYSLNDPLNPVLSASATNYPSAHMTKDGVCGSGPIHAYPNFRQLTYANDGSIAMGKTGEFGIPALILKGSNVYGTRDNVDGAIMSDAVDASIVQFNGYTIAINANPSPNATNLTNLSGSSCQYSGPARPNTSILLTRGLSVQKQDLPPHFPTMPAGFRLPLGNQQFLASFESTNTSDCSDHLTPLCNGVNKLTIYDLTKTTPVASKASSINIGTGIGTARFTQKKIGNYDYIYAISQVTGAPLLSVYKFNYTNNQITVIAERLSLPSGEQVLAQTAVNINGQPGVAIFSYVNDDSENSSNLRVHMNSDLANKKVVDSLDGTGVRAFTKLGVGAGAGSYTKDNSSYVYYYNGNGAKIFALKLDSATSSTPAMTPPSTTPPASLVDCAVGDKYSRMTGKLCAALFKVNECATGDLFSTITGKACNSN